MKVAIQTRAGITHEAKPIEERVSAMLPTTRADGALAGRPMSAREMDAQGAPWFFSDLHASKVDRLRAVNLGVADRDRGACVSAAAAAGGKALVDWSAPS